MNARGSEERSRQLHAPASGRAGLRRDLGRRLRLCAGGGASPLNRAQMPRSRSTCSVSAHQAWLPGPGASEREPRREDPGSPGSRQVCPLPRQGRWHGVLRTRDTRWRRRVSMRAARSPHHKPRGLNAALQVMLPSRHTRHAGKWTFPKGSSKRPATHSKALPGTIFFYMRNGCYLRSHRKTTPATSG